MTTHTIALVDNNNNQPDPGDPNMSQDAAADTFYYVNALREIFQFLKVSGHTVTITLDAVDITPLMFV